MKSFTINKISLDLDIIGEELERTREERAISLERAAKETGINIKYLKALEDGNMEKLPKGVYGKNFLREYALFLGLDARNIIDIYEEEIKSKKEGEQKNIFSQKIPGARYFFSAPKILKNAAIILTLFVCVAYLGYSLKNIFSPPKLIVMSPQEDIITENNYINIKGYTDPGADIIVNGEPILIDAEGFFDKKLSLKDGLNSVSIIAQKKYSRQNKQVKTIMVKGYN